MDAISAVIKTNSQRTIFEPEHDLFRASFRSFVKNEVLPHYRDWEKEGMVSRDLWLKAGANGFLCMDVSEIYGGAGSSDFRYSAIVIEELAFAGATSVYFPLHTDVVAPYLAKYGTEEQKRRWLPKMVSGEYIGAIAITEPDAGSDVAGLRTAAQREGDTYVVNGQKTFVSNGLLNDILVVAVKTNPLARHEGITLLVVERGTPGFERGRRLEKIGLHAQDTAELYFNDARIPVANLLGEEGGGFRVLMEELPRERLSIAVTAIAGARAAFEETLGYARERNAFGRPIGTFQHSRFVLAEMATEITIGQTFIDQCVLACNARNLTTEAASMAKWWATELFKRVTDACVQLHGGYGYMQETPIARHFLDARVQTIFGGTTEIMKEIIGRGLGL